jgi:hypothetical protein
MTKGNCPSDPKLILVLGVALQGGNNPLGDSNKNC